MYKKEEIHIVFFYTLLDKIQNSLLFLVHSALTRT